MTKNAFITIIGKPNVGKSSLLNAIIGEKIAVVSCKPQTTRTQITGVLTQGETQYVFLDTPGMHKAKTKLSQHMVNTINESLSGAEIIIFMADCTRKINDVEKQMLASLKNSVQTILVLNKTDAVPKETVAKQITEYASLADFCEVIPMSVYNGDGMDILMEKLQSMAQQGPHFFPDDSITDQPEKVIMAEMIREKALELLSDEVPHGIAVTIEKISESVSAGNEDILNIDATIFCERESHKGIIIGKGGSMLKKIGSQARVSLEQFFRIKVNLKCWVKVKEGWRNSEALIKNFGFY